LPSFGEKLKAEREKRAVTLEQISASTKIGVRMLQALEEDQFGVLPGGIFNKGFVRAYARHVGLDEDQTIADYLQASGEAQPPELPPDVHPQIASPEIPDTNGRRSIPWGLFAAVVFAIALALWFWSRSQHNTARHSELSPAAAPVTNASAADVRPAGLPAGTQASAKSAPPKEVRQPDPAPAQQILVPAAQITSPSPAPGEFTVLVTAREESWISIKSDGQTAFEGTLLPESQHAVHARKEVQIKAGNAGALDFTFNGRKLESQGDYGEVRTLSFRSSGLQSAPPPTPAPR